MFGQNVHLLQILSVERETGERMTKWQSSLPFSLDDQEPISQRFLGVILVLNVNHVFILRLQKDPNFNIATKFSQ